MVKKKENIHNKRPAGLVINPPTPRPVAPDHPNNYLFPQEPKSFQESLAIDLIENDPTTSDQQNDQKIVKDQQNQAITPSIKNPVFNELSSSNPVHKEPSPQRTQLPNNHSQKPVSTLVSLTSVGGYKTPNFLDDEILPDLNPPEQIVLRRLYRLSYGFNRQITDSVGINKLSQKCNLGESTVKRAIKSLSDRGLIVVHLDNSNHPKGGNRYSVLTGFIMNPVHSEPSSQKTQFTMNSITHDDDPLKRQDHHQSTITNITEHQKQVMMIYQEVTGNLWSKADHTNYEKIKHISIEKIEVALRLANDRATNRPNSFAFFIKEILASLNPKTQSRTNRRKAMQKIVERVRNASVGSNISPSDFAYKVKEICLREDVTFDNDLLDELLSKG
jgi:DNA-binding Lrp family transcriptional regulator